jgi:paraquat-inducible protein A
LHSRKPESLHRSLALLVAASILYIPANILPIMHSHTLIYDEDDTIMSGVLALWYSGSWPLAVLVFFVSILVPTLKLISLSILVVSTHYRWKWRIRERTALYRLLEFIGRWSMLDIFVVGLLVALVQLRGVATIHAEPGAVAFAAVVVLTMYAAQCFDPRLMWDRQENND